MKRWLPVVMLLAGACTWSNSLYQARRLSSAAAKASREERTFDAGSLWGQAAVKADSAYARNPEGMRGAEALWLRGRALARLGDCPGALPVLERALVAARDVGWSDDLGLELARCRALGGDPDGALELLTPLVDGEDGDLRQEARQLAGRALVDAGRWDEAVAMLAEDDTRTGRWQRAIAIAQLGRIPEALDLVESRILAADSSADWQQLVRITATRAPDMVDTLLDALGAMRNAGDTARARWQLAAAEAILPSDPAAGTRRLEAVVAMPESPPVSQARMLLLERRVAAVDDSASLATTLERLQDVGRGDPAVSFRSQALTRWGREILAELAATPAGSADGDLAMFFHATIARDTLRAPRLASHLLLRLEQGWPESPYVAKALLARLPLVPDSAAAIRERLAGFPDSPYLAYLAGRADDRFATLEDALGFYIDGRLAERMAGGDQDLQ